jgi:hypothetical protein
MLITRLELVATLNRPWLGQFRLSTPGIGSRWGSSLAAVAVDNLRELSPAVGGGSRNQFPLLLQSRQGNSCHVGVSLIHKGLQASHVRPFPRSLTAPCSSVSRSSGNGRASVATSWRSQASPRTHVSAPIRSAWQTALNSTLRSTRCSAAKAQRLPFQAECRQDRQRQAPGHAPVLRTSPARGTEPLA